MLREGAALQGVSGSGEGAGGFMSDLSNFKADHERYDDYRVNLLPPWSFAERERWAEANPGLAGFYFGFIMGIYVGVWATFFTRVAVGVDDGIAAQVISLEDAAHLCSSRTIAVTVATGEPAVTFLELCADQFHVHAIAPGNQVSIERS